MLFYCPQLVSYYFLCSEPIPLAAFFAPFTPRVNVSASCSPDTLFLNIRVFKRCVLSVFLLLPKYCNVLCSFTSSHRSLYKNWFIKLLPLQPISGIGFLKPQSLDLKLFFNAELIIPQNDYSGYLNRHSFYPPTSIDLFLVFNAGPQLGMAPLLRVSLKSFPLCPNTVPLNPSPL